MRCNCMKHFRELEHHSGINLKGMTNHWTSLTNYKISAARLFAIHCNSLYHLQKQDRKIHKCHYCVTFAICKLLYHF